MKPIFTWCHKFSMAAQWKELLTPITSSDYRTRLDRIVPPLPLVMKHQTNSPSESSTPFLSNIHIAERIIHKLSHTQDHAVGERALWSEHPQETGFHLSKSAWRVYLRGVGQTVICIPTRLAHLLRRQNNGNDTVRRNSLL